MLVQLELYLTSNDGFWLLHQKRYTVDLNAHWGLRQGEWVASLTYPASCELRIIVHHRLRSNGDALLFCSPLMHEDLFSCTQENRACLARSAFLGRKSHLDFVPILIRCKDAFFGGSRKRLLSAMHSSSKTPEITSIPAVIARVASPAPLT